MTQEQARLISEMHDDLDLADRQTIRAYAAAALRRGERRSAVRDMLRMTDAEFQAFEASLGES